MPFLSELLRGVQPPPEKAWAMGCYQCEHGLIEPPPVSGVPHVTRVDVRLYQYHHGLLNICDCYAGEQYEKFLKRMTEERRLGRSAVSKIEHEKLVAYMELQKQGKEPELPQLYQDDDEVIEANKRQVRRRAVEQR